MPETLDVDALNAAAAQKAHDNDAAGAAQLLRQALDLQAATLGPEHRDLAPTLNNLALMLERQGALDEAERTYRHAYAIAKQGAAPNDPLVLVSRGNLVDFLRATGRPETVDPVEAARPEPAPVAVSRAALPQSGAAPARAPSARPAPSGPPLPSAPKAAGSPAPARKPLPPPAAPPVRQAGSDAVTPAGSYWPFIALAAVLALALITWFASSRSSEPPAPASTPAAAPAPTPPAPGAEVPAAPVDPAPAPAALTRTTPTRTTPAARTPPAATAPVAPSRSRMPEPDTSRPAAPSAPAPEAPPAPAAAPRTDPEPPPSASAAPRTAEPAPARSAPRPQSPGEFGRPRDGISADGDVCAGLTRTGNPWRCSPLGEGGTVDAVYYYTRVRSPRDVVVRHRWSYGGAVVRTVDLRVSANTAPGFRTFSRQPTGGRRGEWEVTLLGPDGAVVDSQRFTVK